MYRDFYQCEIDVAKSEESGICQEINLPKNIYNSIFGTTASKQNAILSYQLLYVCINKLIWLCGHTSVVWTTNAFEYSRQNYNKTLIFQIGRYCMGI